MDNKFLQRYLGFDPLRNIYRYDFRGKFGRNCRRWTFGSYIFSNWFVVCFGIILLSFIPHNT